MAYQLFKDPGNMRCWLLLLLHAISAESISRASKPWEMLLLLNAEWNVIPLAVIKVMCCFVTSKIKKRSTIVFFCISSTAHASRSKQKQKRPRWDHFSFSSTPKLPIRYINFSTPAQHVDAKLILARWNQSTDARQAQVNFQLRPQSSVNGACRDSLST